MKRAFKLGQLSIEFDGEAAVVHGPAAATPEIEVEASEEPLRNWVRHDAARRYRPLPGSNDMQPGWRARCDDASLTLAEVLEIVYPLAMLHVAQHREGTLRVVPLPDVLERQSGRYARAVTLSAEARDVAVSVLCGQCVKQPVWHGANAGKGEIPCPEACSVMVSLCRDAALWESTPPTNAPVDVQLPWAAFERPGNAIREQYLRERFETSDQVGLSDG